VSRGRKTSYEGDSDCRCLLDRETPWPSPHGLTWKTYVLCMCPISGNAEIATRAPHLHSYKLRRAIHYMAGKVFPLIEKRDEWGSRLWSSYRVYAFGGSRSGKHGLEVSS
jgi:hypothetical protein